MKAKVSKKHLQKVRNEVKKLSEENFMTYCKKKLKHLKHKVSKGRQTLLRDFQVLEHKLKVKNLQLDSKVQTLLKEMDMMAVDVKENYKELNSKSKNHGYSLPDLGNLDLTDKKCPFVDNQIQLESYPFNPNLEIFGIQKASQNTGGGPEIPKLNISNSQNQIKNGQLYPNGLPIILPSLNLQSTVKKDKGVLPTNLNPPSTFRNNIQEKIERASLDYIYQSVHPGTTFDEKPSKASGSSTPQFQKDELEAENENYDSKAAEEDIELKLDKMGLDDMEAELRLVGDQILKGQNEIQWLLKNLEKTNEYLENDVTQRNRAQEANPFYNQESNAHDALTDKDNPMNQFNQAQTQHYNDQIELLEQLQQQIQFEQEDLANIRKEVFENQEEYRMRLIMKDLEDIEQKKISGKIEDKREEILKIQKELEGQKDIIKENKIELRSFLQEMNALKHKLNKLLAMNQHSTDKVYGMKKYFEQDKQKMEDKLPGFLEIYNQNLAKRDELNQQTERFQKEQKKLNDEVEKIIKVNDDIGNAATKRDKLLKEIQDWKKSEMSRKVIEKISKFLIRLKLKKLEADARSLQITVDELKAKIKEEDAKGASKQAEVDKAKELADQIQKDQDQLRTQLREEQNKKEEKDIKKNELELQYNQLKKDVENMVKKRDNKINELKLKKQECKNKEEALKAELKRLKEELLEKSNDLEFANQDFQKKKDDFEDRTTKYEKKKKELGFFEFIVNQKLENQKEMNKKLLEEQKDLQKQLKECDKQNTEVIFQKTQLGKKKKSNNAMSNDIEDLTLKLAELIKERDGNNDADRLQEIESELKMVNEEQTKTKKGIADQKKKNKSKKESLEEESIKNENLETKAKKLKKKIEGKQLDSENQLSGIGKKIQAEKSEIEKLEKEIAETKQKNAQELKKAQESNIKQRQEHEDLIAKLKAEYESWRIKSEPSIPPLKQYFDTTLDQIDSKNEEMLKLEAVLEPKQEKMKNMMKETQQKRMGFVKARNDHVEEIMSSRFLLRQLKSKTDEKRMEIIKLYIDLMILDKIKDKASLMDTHKNFIKNWRKESNLYDQTRYAFKDQKKAIDKEREELTNEIDKLNNELGTILKKGGFI